jgi:hypothetical protein
MSYIAYILNIVKSLWHVKEIFKFISNNKGIALLFLVLSLTTSILAEGVIRTYLHNRGYNTATELDNINNYIDRILRQCGDKTGITISAISLNLDANVDAYGGRFYIARACDSREVEKNCIMNLKDFKPATYAMEQNIDRNSYYFLKRIGDQSNATRFYLRDKNNNQNISSLDKYISIKEIILATDWYKEKTLYNLWVTSIMSRDNILYVITYLSGTSMEKSACFNPSLILRDIKQYIKK